MDEILVGGSGDSLWRKIGEKAVITLVNETVKAIVDLAKRAKLREQKAAFGDRRKREKDQREKDKRGADEPAEVVDDDAEEADDEEADAADSDESSDTDSPEAPSEEDGPKVDFARYVARQKSG